MVDHDSTRQMLFPGHQFKTSLLCYQIANRSSAVTTTDVRPNFLYWKSNENILGLTDLVDVYEANLGKRERRVLLRNVSDQILEIRWSGAFKSKSFRLGEKNDKEAEIVYVTQKQKLLKVSENARDCITEIFKTLLSEHETLTEMVEERSVSSPPKRRIAVPATSTQDPFNRNRRRIAIDRDQLKPGGKAGSSTNQAKIGARLDDTSDVFSRPKMES